MRFTIKTALHNGSETVTYTYDTFNRRQTRTVGDHHQRFFYLDNEEIGACDTKGSIVELKVLGRHQAVAIEIDSKAYAVITDHFGNTAQLIDPCTGNPVANYRFSAFGEETLSSDLITPWRYHQKREDPLTQLIYFGYRDYDSEIGGWTTPDPLGFADGPNLYAYVHHNPVTFHDPDGTTAYQYHDQYRPQRSWRRQFWNGTKQIVNSFSRGFIDDTSWGTSEYLFGEHQSTNWTQKVGYGAGTVASLGAGLLYGSTEAKIAAYGYKGLKFTGKQLLNHGSKLCTRNFKRVTVMNSTGTVAKATKHTEKYFIKKDTTCKLLGVDKLSRAPKGAVGKPPSIQSSLNPFKGKSFEEIDYVLRKKGFTTKGPDPINGKGSYFHPVTNRKYYLDHAGKTYRKGITELPHVDVHYRKPFKNIDKKRFALGDSLYE